MPFCSPYGSKCPSPWEIQIDDMAQNGLNPKIDAWSGKSGPKSLPLMAFASLNLCPPQANSKTNTSTGSLKQTGNPQN